MTRPRSTRRRGRLGREAVRPPHPPPQAAPDAQVVGEDDFPHPYHLDERENLLDEFCAVQLGQTGGPAHARLRLRPRKPALDALRGRLVTTGDTLSWAIISHEFSGHALLIVQHSMIIGSHWLAYLDPASVPVEQEAPSGG